MPFPKIWLSLTIALLLSSCASYEVPLCDESNRQDVTNFEGHYSATFAMVQEKNSKVIRQNFSVSRLDRGLYLFESPERSYPVSVCEIGSTFYLEQMNPASSEEAKIYNASILNTNGDGSFDQVMLGVDSDVLTAQDIPFRIIQLSAKLGNDKPTDTPTYTIVVNNRGISRERLVQLLDPISMKVTFLPNLAP